jgi:DNA polymerase-4
VSRLWGVGPKTEAILKAAGLRTIGDVAQRDPRWLTSRLGSAGEHFFELSRGIDERPIVTDRSAKSIGTQDTFPEDLEGREALAPYLHAQSWRVGRRLRHAGLRAKGVQLTLKYSDFTHVTRQKTIAQPTDDGQLLYREALELLAELNPQRAVRLTGVSAFGFGTTETQLSLFATAPDEKTTRLNAALDRIAGRFGSSAIHTADVTPTHESASVSRGDRNSRGVA